MCALKLNPSARSTLAASKLWTASDYDPRPVSQPDQSRGRSPRKPSMIEVPEDRVDELRAAGAQGSAYADTAEFSDDGDDEDDDMEILTKKRMKSNSENQ